MSTAKQLLTKFTFKVPSPSKPRQLTEADIERLRAWRLAFLAGLPPRDAWKWAVGHVSFERALKAIQGGKDK